METVQVTFRMPIELHRRLVAKAEEEGRTRTSMIVWFLMKCLQP